MKFRNPWIDPRVAAVRSEDVESYLVQHGWKDIGLAENPRLRRFEVLNGSEDAPTLFLPTARDDGPASQWMIDLLGELAIWENRFAGDLLTDILQNRGQKQTHNVPQIEAPEAAVANICSDARAVP